MTVDCWSVEDLHAGYRRLPAASGVYVFVDRDGCPVYVGKSVNLRARLAQYVHAGRGGRAVSGRRGKEARIIGAADSVRIERSGGEFAALLRELELIQSYRPRWNRRMRSPERYVFIEVDYAAEFPLIAVSSARDDGRSYLGPFLQRRRVEQVVAALNDAFALRTCTPIPARACWRMQTRRCSAPCIGEVSAGQYGRQLLAVREALLGRTRAALDSLRAARESHSRAERFEAAASAQRRIEALEGLARVLFASALDGRDALIAQPGVADGEVVAWAVVGGTVRDCARGCDANLQGVYRRLRGAMARPAAVGPTAKLELDRRCIVHAWIRRNCLSAGVIPTNGVGEGAIRQAFVDTVAALRRDQGLFAVPVARPGEVARE